MRHLPIGCSVLLALAAGASAQDLRRGLVAADAVVVARQVGKAAHDDDVTLRVYRGLLRPEVGTRGLITPDQTFDFDYASPVSMVEGARIMRREVG
jgi:hypothetical protein